MADHVGGMLHLRDYQRECLDAVYAAHGVGMRRPAVVLPTGAGKTVIFSHLAREHLTFTGTRVLILVHRDELADQAISKLSSVAPQLSVGKVKAADNEVTADVVVGSVQTLVRPSRMRRLLDVADLQPFGLVVVDEAHHAVAPSYRRIMDYLDVGRGDSGPVAVGFTATLARGDGVGLGSVWDEVVFQRSVLWMISRGYLTDVRGRAVEMAELDLGAVKRSGGDYAAGSLGEALEAADGPRVIARAMTQYVSERRSIVFTPTVATAVATTTALNARGIPADYVHGGTSRGKRLEVYRAFRTGELRALVNCMVLTEGFDAPWADCAVIARPTQSAPLYVQMVGRVLRPWPGKADALVLDLAATGGRLATLVDLEPGLLTAPRPGKSLAEAYIEQEQRANERVPAGSLAFELRHRDLDLFTASSQSWLRTAAGVMFIPIRGGYVFLWPSQAEPGTWDVCGAPEGRGVWHRLHTRLPLGTAMAWAETEAEERSDFTTVKKARWRREPAAPRAVGLARSMGLQVPEGARKGEVSDMISVALASRRFDAQMRRVTV